MKLGFGNKKQKVETTKKEMSEIELKNIAKELMESKKSDIVAIRNIDTMGKENPNFKKTKGMPLIRKGGIFGLGSKKIFSKRIDWKIELKEELKKEKPNYEKLKKISKKLEEGKDYKDLPIKTPYLELIRADGSKEWFEGVKAGILEIRRSDESLGYINLDKNKLLTDDIRNVNDRVVQGWICNENDYSPLPTNVFMDSKGVYQNYEEIMKNRKDIQTERIKSLEGLTWTIGLAIVAIITILFVIVPMFTGQSIFEMMPQQTTIQQCSACTGQLGILSPEEQIIIKQYRAEIEKNTAEPD